MSDADSPVACARHGTTAATFLCRHLVEGVACGYHASESESSDRWPDAWCDACDEALQAAGGAWDDASEAQPDIQILCTGCYELARYRNQTVPALARGRTARLTDEEQARLFHHAVHDANARNDASDARWKWRAYPRWDFDADAATLTFSGPGLPTVVAEVELVGSYSTNTGTFQWEWATAEARDRKAGVSSRVRTFGEVRGVARLTTKNWETAQEDGWEMASLACYLLDAQAVYRPPFEHLYWFMLLRRFRTEAASSLPSA